MENNQGHYHLHYRKFTRSDGKSAPEAAAYRLATRIHDERTGLTHDYTAKRGVTETIILGPASQTLPAWAKDPSQLWNKVEAAEKNNPRSLVMHELEIALPASLSADQRRAAALEMAQFITDRYGCIAHLAFHNPNREGDQRNYHVHLMFTPRSLMGDDFAPKKIRNFSRREPEALRDGQLTGAEEILFMRKTWAEIGNKHLQRAGLPPTLDHRSYEDQGLDLEPQKHLGPDATAKERRGERTAKGDFNRAAADRNRQKLAWAQAWEQAKADITGAPPPAPEPTPPARPDLPFATASDPKRHEALSYPPGFETLMNNQIAERTSLVHLHITERKTLWRAQQEMRQSNKKPWAQLYRRQRLEREALEKKLSNWSNRMLRKLDFTGRVEKTHHDALLAQEERHKIERAHMGRENKYRLLQEGWHLEDKHRKDLRKLDKLHISQRQEFLSRSAQQREWAERFAQRAPSRDKGRGRGRDR